MVFRRILLHCDIPARDILCNAIRDYANTAYPEGGSGCAQVAAEIRDGISEEKFSVEISKRPKPMINAALEYYFDRQDDACDTTSMHQRKLFVSLLCGEHVPGVELVTAVAADRAGL